MDHLIHRRHRLKFLPSSRRKNDPGMAAMDDWCTHFDVLPASLISFLFCPLRLVDHVGDSGMGGMGSGLSAAQADPPALDRVKRHDVPAYSVAELYTLDDAIAA